MRYCRRHRDNFFTHMLRRMTWPADLFGPVDINKLREELHGQA